MDDLDYPKAGTKVKTAMGGTITYTKTGYVHSASTKTSKVEDDDEDLTDEL